MAKNVNLLAEISQQEKTMKTEGGKQPSVIVIERIIELLKQIIFPGYFGAEIRSRESRLYHVGVSMEALEKDLKEQICLSFRSFKGEDVKEETSDEIALKFIDTLPEIKRVLYTDIEAMSNADPAVTAYGEIIFCYPIVQVMLHYRVAHALLRLGVPVLPRIITEMAHSKTGIDIHPGAQIGEYFSIDHGTGVVIGETCIIGNHVTLYFDGGGSVKVRDAKGKALTIVESGTTNTYTFTKDTNGLTDTTDNSGRIFFETPITKIRSVCVLNGTYWAHARYLSDTASLIYIKNIDTNVPAPNVSVTVTVVKSVSFCCL